MNLDNLPVIDWNLATKLAGNKKEVAEELLALFLKSLPIELSAILASFDTQDFPELLRRVHKLHGASCYCGVPRLKTVLAQLETTLKNDIIEDNISSLVNQLNTEANLLLERNPLSSL